MDGVAVSGKLADSDRDLPSAWWPPKTTPPLRGDSRPLRFGGWSSIRPLLFDLTIPTGTSVLTVSYTEKVKIIFARPAMFRQFAYILAPAKSWSSFKRFKPIHPGTRWMGDGYEFESEKVFEYIFLEGLNQFRLMRSSSHFDHPSTPVFLSFNVTEVTPCWLYSYWSLLDHGGAGGRRFWQVGIKHWDDPTINPRLLIMQKTLCSTPS